MKSILERNYGWHPVAILQKIGDCLLDFSFGSLL